MWDSYDWRLYFNERLAIATEDGGLSEAEARKVAWEGCIAKWLEDNPLLVRGLAVEALTSIMGEKRGERRDEKGKVYI